ncbi:hypothetical protein F3Y22_tig00112471pilonHSYRG00033 [Hibiscus syriacus]|uniref:Uncharacterized protein n=1 Tax=Hibiscus syriacus TaxID=106335 RepID=A0A6A2Y3U7_HIBSY|nr:hypothetical protein F3Y22_tig00112471pilonHSYRG00033 [Hibiscus syriacus]
MASITPLLHLTVPTAGALSFRKRSSSREDGFDVCKSNGGRLSVFACSTTPYVRRVGSERLPFGNKTDGGATKGDLFLLFSPVRPLLPLVSKELYAPALGGIMLTIGIKLSLDDFALAVKRPLPLSVGLVVQYMLKLVLGLLIAKAFGVYPMFYAGFILTCCVAGAQLSSYASFLSKGDVAVVLVPVALGLVLNTYAKLPSRTSTEPESNSIKRRLQLVLPVLTFHAVAFAVGYWILKIRAFRQREEVCRKVSLCSGMQSSTMAGFSQLSSWEVAVRRFQQHALLYQWLSWVFHLPLFGAMVTVFEIYWLSSSHKLVVLFRLNESKLKSDDHDNLPSPNFNGTATMIRLKLVRNR